MNKTHISILKEISQEREKYFKDYIKFTAEIKKKAEKLLKNVKVLIFGSVIKNLYHPFLSDIDILVISDNLPKNWEDRRFIKLKLKPFGSPFQIHLVTNEEYENQYKNFIKEDYIEI
ncbi:MAG: nucleotidyltransferase domain-containing protein [Candidatus Omnitrophica bacterium]|nr:nucleotidyltransferase domain-containing protein [Candidatus Omnitrophota bacterium]MCM8806489.1 nucleotidyltransferase domain-containing protein [Candidatus Omnitrophota bacterium]